MNSDVRKPRRPAGIVVIVLFHVCSFLLWFFGQTLAVFDYDMVATWGLQTPRALADRAIVAMDIGLARADTIIQLPLFLVAAIGLWRMRFWGAVASWMAFGCSIYWPVIYWSTDAAFADAGIRNVPIPAIGFLIPGTIWLIAAWGTWYLFRHRAAFE